MQGHRRAPLRVGQCSEGFVRPGGDRSRSQGSASARNFSPPHIGAGECSPPLAEGFGIGSISDVCCGASAWCGSGCAGGGEQSVPASSKEVART